MDRKDGNDHSYPLREANNVGYDIVGIERKLKNRRKAGRQQRGEREEQQSASFPERSSNNAEMTISTEAGSAMDNEKGSINISTVVQLPSVSNQNTAANPPPAIDPSVIAALKELLQPIETQMTNFATRMTNFETQMTQISAALYEVQVQSWIIHQIKLWWNVTSTLISNRIVKKTLDEKYLRAFDRAANWYSNPDRAMFRAVHSAVHEKSWHVFDMLEYNGLGSGQWTSKDTVPPVSSAAVSSPERLGSKPTDNTILVVEFTMRNVSPARWLLEEWRKFWGTASHSEYIVRDFEKHLGLAQGNKDLNVLKVLLLKLLQLEKQVTLQLLHFYQPQSELVVQSNSLETLRKCMRAALVCRAPAGEDLHQLLVCDTGKKVFTNISALYEDGHFKMLEYNPNYTSLI